jgi:AraC-like DNA-binding protein
MGIIQYDPDPFLVGRHDLGQMMGFHALFDLEPRSHQDEQFRKRLRLTTTQLGEIDLLLHSLDREYHNRDEGWRTMIQAGFFQLTTRLSRYYTSQKQDTPSPMVRMAHVASHIRKHFQRAIRIEELAKIAHLSPSQFQRVFKRTYHATPGEFVHRLRIDHACQLLRDENRDIASIATTCGFSTPAFFSTQFKRSSGITPSDYRRSILQSQDAIPAESRA